MGYFFQACVRAVYGIDMVQCLVPKIEIGEYTVYDQLCGIG